MTARPSRDDPIAPELRWGVAFVAGGGVLIVAGGVTAAVNSAAPFEHGSWPAANLVLLAAH